MAVSSNMSQFYIENDENQFFELGGFFSSTMEMNGSKQHPILPFTLSTRFKDLVLTSVIYHTTLLQSTMREELSISCYMSSWTLALSGIFEKRNGCLFGCQFCP